MHGWLDGSQFFIEIDLNQSGKKPNGNSKLSRNNIYFRLIVKKNKENKSHN